MEFLERKRRTNFHSFRLHTGWRIKSDNELNRILVGQKSTLKVSKSLTKKIQGTVMMMLLFFCSLSGLSVFSSNEDNRCSVDIGNYRKMGKFFGGWMYNSKKTHQLGGYQNIFHPPLEGWFTELLYCLDFGQLPRATKCPTWLMDIWNSFYVKRSSASIRAHFSGNFSKTITILCYLNICHDSPNFAIKLDDFCSYS